MKNICVVGLGYIGLPCASLLATKGFQVHGVDVKKETVEALNKGEVLIFEPSLDVLVKSAVNSGNLKADTKPIEADTFILAVPTPFKNDHEPDISYIEKATEMIAPFVKAGDLIILESTSPVGTTEKISNWLRKLRSDLKISSREDLDQDSDAVLIAHCPERVLPGKILRELVENDRIVGGINQQAAMAAGEFYRSFVSGQIVLTDSRTAELCKLTENAFRDVNIAFANELSLICEDLEIDVWELISLANHHPRVNILQPGPGVGGHCIAVDPWFIVDSSPKNAKLIKMAREVNTYKTEAVISKIAKASEKFKAPKIACFGLAFKANIDDLRESPAVEIVKALAFKNVGELLIVEPNVKDLPAELSKFSNIEFMESKKAIEEADIIVLLVDHREFKTIQPRVLAEKIIIDTRGIWTKP